MVEEPIPTDRGQVLPLVALLIAVMGLAVIGLGWLGATLVEEATATTAADAAALAGVTRGRDAAARVAEDNGATLVSFERLPPRDVRVVIRRGSALASARARASGAGAAAQRAPGFPQSDDG